MDFRLLLLKWEWKFGGKCTWFPSRAAYQGEKYEMYKNHIGYSFPLTISTNTLRLAVWNIHARQITNANGLVRHQKPKGNCWRFIFSAAQVHLFESPECLLPRKLKKLINRVWNDMQTCFIKSTAAPITVCLKEAADEECSHSEGSAMFQISPRQTYK